MCYSAYVAGEKVNVLLNILRFIGWFIVMTIGTILGLISIGLVLFLLVNFSLVLLPIIVLALIIYAAAKKVKDENGNVD